MSLLSKTVHLLNSYEYIYIHCIWGFEAHNKQIIFVPPLTRNFLKSTPLRNSVPAHIEAVENWPLLSQVIVGISLLGSFFYIKCYESYISTCSVSTNFAYCSFICISKCYFWLFFFFKEIVDEKWNLIILKATNNN